MPAIGDRSHTRSLRRTPPNRQAVFLTMPSSAFIGGVTQHGPDRRAFPATGLLARRDPLLIEQAGDRTDAETVNGIALVHPSNDRRLHLVDLVIRRRLLVLANIVIPYRRTAEHADLPLSGAMPLAATRTFEDLCPLVFRDHALELQQQLILGCCRPWRADKQGLDTGPSELLDQQDLIGVASTEPIRGIDQHGVELAFSRQVAHALEAGTDQTRAPIAFVFEYPFRWNSAALLGGERDQRRRLAGDGVLLLLLVRGYPGVDCRRLHRPLRSACCPRPALGQARR